VTEGGRHEPVACDAEQAAAPATADRRLPFQEADSSTDRGVMGVADLVRSLRASKGEEQRHRLRGREGGIEPSDRRMGAATGKGVDRAGMPVRQDRGERVGVDLAGQAQTGRGRAVPLARSLLGPGVVLLGALGHGVEVVLLLTGSQLAQAQHGRLPRLTTR